MRSATLLAAAGWWAAAQAATLERIDTVPGMPPVLDPTNLYSETVACKMSPTVEGHLKTLWVANNAEGRTDGSLTPIDPLTGKPGKAVRVDDPYNLYWTPDGHNAVVIAEELRRLDFREPHTMKREFSIAVPKCGGIKHAHFSIDGSYALFTCEFDGAVTKIDLVNRTVVGTLMLTPFYQRPDVVAQLAVFEKKPAIVSDSQELGEPICSS